MPICLVPDASGAVHTTQDAPASCTGYLAVTPDEYSNLAGSIWVPLSLGDGVLISMSILGIWALAFILRAIRLGFVSQTGDS